MTKSILWKVCVRCNPLHRLVRPSAKRGKKLFLCAWRPRCAVSGDAWHVFLACAHSDANTHRFAPVHGRTCLRRLLGNVSPRKPRHAACSCRRRPSALKADRAALPPWSPDQRLWCRSVTYTPCERRRAYASSCRVGGRLFEPLPLGRGGPSFAASEAGQGVFRHLKLREDEQLI